MGKLTENGRGYMSVTGDPNMYPARVTRRDDASQLFDYAFTVDGKVFQVKDVPFTAFTPTEDGFIIAEARMPSYIIMEDTTPRAPKNDYVIVDDTMPRKPKPGYVIMDDIIP